MGLEGTWYNDLNSSMTITVGDKGALSGQYTTGVWDGTEPTPTPLVGAMDPAPVAGKPISFGIVVAWGHPATGGGSTTSWSGALRTAGGEEVLVTRWLLTMEHDADWTSTLVGEDVFYRKPPSKEVVQRALAIRKLAPLPSRPPTPPPPNK